MLTRTPRLTYPFWGVERGKWLPSSYSSELTPTLLSVISLFCKFVFGKLMEGWEGEFLSQVQDVNANKA